MAPNAATDLEARIAQLEAAYGGLPDLDARVTALERAPGADAIAIASPSGQLLSLTEGAAARNQLFINAVSGKLSWKDSSGNVHILSVDAGTYSGFTVENMPPATYQPFSSAVWNNPISAPQVHPSSAEIVNYLMTAHGAPQPSNMTAGKEELGGAGNEKTDVAHPVLWAAATDPEYEIHCTREAGNVNEKVKIKIPTTPKTPWAQGTDGHLCVVQPNGLMYEFYKVASIEAGKITANWCDVASIAGLGWTKSPGGGVTAGDAQLLGGVIRPEELIAFQAKGPTTIKHALNYVSLSSSNNLTYGFGVEKGASGSSFVYPAFHGGSETATAGAPPMGARLQLNMTRAEIEALGLPPWKECIALTMAEYGAYLMDNSGGGTGFQFLSERSYNAYNKPSPLVAYAAANLSASLIKNAEGFYVFKLAEGIPWAEKSRILVPPAH